MAKNWDNSNKVSRRRNKSRCRVISKVQYYFGDTQTQDEMEEGGGIIFIATRDFFIHSSSIQSPCYRNCIQTFIPSSLAYYCTYPLIAASVSLSRVAQTFRSQDSNSALQIQQKERDYYFSTALVHRECDFSSNPIVSLYIAML